MNTSEEFLERFLAFLNDLLPDLRGKPNPGERIAPDSKLFENGTLDSLSILHVLAFIERQIGAAVPDDLIIPENFRSPRAIAETFGRLRR
jgi:acyl carrier protein